MVSMAAMAAMASIAAIASIVDMANIFLMASNAAVVSIATIAAMAYCLISKLTKQSMTGRPISRDAIASKKQTIRSRDYKEEGYLKNFII